MSPRECLKPAGVLASFVLLTSVFALASEASTARWRSLAVPEILGLDDSALPFFPALAAETAPGFYADPLGSSRYLALLGGGNRRIWAGVVTGDEIRAGVVGPRLAGIATGVSAWYSVRTYESSSATSSGPPEERSVSGRYEEMEFGGLVGARLGAPGGRHLDAAFEVSSHRSESASRRMEAAGDTLAFRTEPVGRPTWSARGMLSLPVSRGWLRAHAVVSDRRSDQELTEWTGYPTPTERDITDETKSLGGDVAWMGSVGRVDLVAAGVSIAYSRWTTGSPLLDEAFERRTRSETRELSASFFVGAELELSSWCAVRAGGVRSYNRLERESEDVLISSGGERRQRVTTEQQRLEYPTLYSGVGLHRGPLRADFNVRLGEALSNLFHVVSVSYLF